MKTRIRGRRPLKFSIFALVALILFGMAPTVGASKAAGAGTADTAVLEWNLHAVNALHNAPTAPTPGAGQPPQVAILHIAMVHGAIYDAVVSIQGGYQPYLSAPRAPRSASTEAAVATAAHHVLVGMELVPPLAPAIVDRLDTLWEESIASATEADGRRAVAAGIVAGEAAAAAMLAARADDGRFVPFEIEPGTEPGEWRPTPPTNISDPFAWVGNVDPFVLESPSQFRSKGPHAVHTGIYAREYNEVKTLGAIDSARTPEQEAVAKFFMVNPVELYNRAFRTLAATEGLTVVQQARLFAMLNMAGSDALINCFNDKIHYRFWRPITAIQLGDDDGNHHTIGDPDWTPMVPTPPYSDHASGYNCVTAAVMFAAKDFFGRHQPAEFSLVRVVPGEPDITRTYARFTDVIVDTVDARVWQGLHFRTSDVQGAEIGRNAARWLNKHSFQPVR